MLGRLWGAWRGESARVHTGEATPLVVRSLIEITLEDLAKDEIGRASCRERV